MIAVLIAYTSAGRLLNPVRISFDQAIVIAVLGLGVNLASAWLLRDEHGHESTTNTSISTTTTTCVPPTRMCSPMP